MNGLWYLFIHDAKNKLLELRRKPGKLIMYLIVFGAMTYFVVLSIIQDPPEESLVDVRWLTAILMALFAFTLFAAIKQGFEKGTAIFKMEDVNNLFVSPLNPQSILFFGVVRMMKTAILSCVFILFNAQTLRTFFDVQFDGVMIVFAAFVLVTAVSQLMTLVIYSFTNSRPKRQNLVKVLIAVAFAPLVIGMAWHLVSANMNFSEGLLSFMTTPIDSFTPIIGWAAAGVVAFIVGNITGGIIYFSLLLGLGLIFLAAIYLGKPDYYEDVLVATETAFEKEREIAEGNINTAMGTSDKVVKVKGTGIKGYGASAIFYRHVREAFRQNKLGLWGFSSLILVGAATAYAIILSRSDGSGVLLGLTIAVMVIQFFIVSTSRGERDTYTHYIYMIPENPVKKLIWSNIEVMLKVVVQNTVIFVVAGIIAGYGPLLILASILVCTMFAFVMLGISYLSMRFTGSHMSRGLLGMIYMVIIVIVMAPGIVGLIAAISLFGESGLLYGLLILTAWELIAGLVCFIISRGVLHNTDIPNLTTQNAGS